MFQLFPNGSDRPILEHLSYLLKCLFLPAGPPQLYFIHPVVPVTPTFTDLIHLLLDFYLFQVLKAVIYFVPNHPLNFSIHPIYQFPSLQFCLRVTHLH